MKTCNDIGEKLSCLIPNGTHLEKSRPMSKETIHGTSVEFNLYMAREGLRPYIINMLRRRRGTNPGSDISLLGLHSDDMI